MPKIHCYNLVVLHEQGADYFPWDAGYPRFQGLVDQATHIIIQGGKSFCAFLSLYGTLEFVIWRDVVLWFHNYAVSRRHFTSPCTIGFLDT